MRYDSLTITSRAVMYWNDGDPCSYCGKPVNAEWHRFESGGKEWKYYAPTYHNVDQKLGFCDAKCSMDWALADYI